MSEKNKYLATVGTACTIIGFGAGLVGMITPVIGEYQIGLRQMIFSIIMMWLAIDAFQGMNRNHSNEKETSQ